MECHAARERCLFALAAGRLQHRQAARFIFQPRKIPTSGCWKYWRLPAARLTGVGIVRIVTANSKRSCALMKQRFANECQIENVHTGRELHGEEMDVLAPPVVEELSRLPFSHWGVLHFLSS